MSPQMRRNILFQVYSQSPAAAVRVCFNREHFEQDLAAAAFASGPSRDALCKKLVVNTDSEVVGQGHSLARPTHHRQSVGAMVIVKVMAKVHADTTLLSPPPLGSLPRRAMLSQLDSLPAQEEEDDYGLRSFLFLGKALLTCEETIGILRPPEIWGRAAMARWSDR